MSYFPFFMEIAEKECLVVGGGVVALRKVEKLLPFGVRIRVVSPCFSAEWEKLRGIERICRPFLPKDVEGMAFVIGATDDETVNGEIARLCRERGIPVNIVDDREKCTFFFPALVKRGEFVAGITTGGNSPLAARFIRQRLEETIPAGFEDTVELLGSLRRRVKQELMEGKEREAFFRQVFLLALEKDGAVTPGEIESLLEGRKSHEG